MLNCSHMRWSRCFRSFGQQTDLITSDVVWKAFSGKWKNMSYYDVLSWIVNCHLIYLRIIKSLLRYGNYGVYFIWHFRFVNREVSLPSITQYIDLGALSVRRTKITSPGQQTISLWDSQQTELRPPKRQALLHTPQMQLEEGAGVSHGQEGLA